MVDDDDDGRRTTDDGRTPDHGHPISSPCEPNGSGELKMGHIRAQNREKMQQFRSISLCMCNVVPTH